MYIRGLVLVLCVLAVSAGWFKAREVCKGYILAGTGAAAKKVNIKDKPGHGVYGCARLCRDNSPAKLKETNSKEKPCLSFNWIEDSSTCEINNVKKKKTDACNKLKASKKGYYYET